MIAMPKKILFCATVDYHFKAFHLPYMKWFKEQGWEVHVAAAGTINLPLTDIKFNLPIHRSPFNLANIKAYNELKTIIDKENYTLIHCHTPIGGVLARFAARKARRYGTKVIYTAHGFHFCKGAPLVNWLVYYPIEKHLSRFTDCLITINTEDYNLAHKHRFNAGSIDHVHGVGIDIERFKPLDELLKKERRKQYGYHRDDLLLFYAAEFNKNKNQQLLIKVLAKIKKELSQARLILAGTGAQVDECRHIANSLGVENAVDFLGFRKDIHQMLPMCDIAVSSSFREGLPVNIMEAMACGLPVVVSDNRGHKELVRNNENGSIIDIKDINGFVEQLTLLGKNEELRKNLGLNGRQTIKNQYCIKKILEEKEIIYSRFLNKRGDYEWAVQ